MSNVRSHTLLGAWPPRRQVRERELVAATRALFDERGHAGRADRGDRQVRRHRARPDLPRSSPPRRSCSSSPSPTTSPSSSELLRDGDDRQRASPAAQLERVTEAYAGFCLRYPAFLDCSLSLMRRPATRAAARGLRVGLAAARPGDGELHRAARTARSSETALRRRGPGLHGERAVDPDARDDAPRAHRASACASSRPACPELFRVDPDRLVDSCVASAVAVVSRS